MTPEEKNEILEYINNHNLNLFQYQVHDIDAVDFIDNPLDDTRYSVPEPDDIYICLQDSNGNDIIDANPEAVFNYLRHKVHQEKMCQP